MAWTAQGESQRGGELSVNRNVTNYINQSTDRWLFIIEGVATISIAVTAYFVLPNLPRNTPWLSEFERDLVSPPNYRVASLVASKTHTY